MFYIAYQARGQEIIDALTINYSKFGIVRFELITQSFDFEMLASGEVERLIDARFSAAHKENLSSELVPIFYPTEESKEELIELQAAIDDDDIAIDLGARRYSIHNPLLDVRVFDAQVCFSKDKVTQYEFAKNILVN